MNCFPANRKRNRSLRRASLSGRSRSRRALVGKGGDQSCKSSSADMMVLAKQGKFDEILARLSVASPSSGGVAPTKNRLGSMYVTNPDEAAFPLHALLRHRPPVEVVNAMIQQMQQDLSTLAPGVLVPEEMREQTLHQTPLHVAVASGCSLQVMERLLQGESLVMPAMAKDGLHRFPLHWAACTVNAAGKKPWPWHPRFAQTASDYQYDVIHLLLQQYAVAAVIPDMYQQTPLDYARHNKLHPSVVELLEEVAIEYERYAPPRKSSGASPLMKEHTEATSVESELVPEELPSLINPAAAPTNTWWNAADDVSSLGGDFPSYFSYDDGNTNPITHVTSLFSSALTFSANGNAKVVSTTEQQESITLPSAPGTLNAGNMKENKKPLRLPLVEKKGSSRLLGNDPAEASEHSSSSPPLLYSPGKSGGAGGGTRVVLDPKPGTGGTTTRVTGAGSANSSPSVRAKTLLKGHIHVKGRRRRTDVQSLPDTEVKRATVLIAV